MDEATQRQGRQIDVGQIEHVGAMALGGFFLLLGLSKRGLARKIFSLTGAALVFRGAQGYEPVYRALGIPFRRVPTNPGRGALRAESMIDVDRPREEMYRLWRDLENLPAFMSNLLSVRAVDPVRSHWVAKGPAGTVVSWDAEVINDIENELIAWQTVEGSSIDHAGSIHFEPLEDGRTRIRVVLRYDPPARGLGEAFARLFHDDPQSQMDEDLRRFKAMVEALSSGSAKLR